MSVNILMFISKNWLAPSWKTDILATLAKLFGIIFSSNINRKHHRFGSVFVGPSAFRKRNGAALASTRTFPKWMEQILDGPKIWDEIFWGVRLLGIPSWFFWTQKIPKTSWKEGLRLRFGEWMTYFKVKDSDVFSGLVDRLGDSIANWKKECGGNVRKPRRKLQELGKKSRLFEWQIETCLTILLVHLPWIKSFSSNRAGDLLQTRC